MDSELEYIMSLANDGKYDEARKAVEALEISAARKATINMQIWQMQRNAESAGYDSERIPKFPVISMILGFALLISTGYLFKGSLQDFFFVIGLIMVGAIPAYYCIKEKRLIDSVSHKRDKEAQMYAEEDADINFSRPLPAPHIVVMGISAGVLFIIGILMTNLFNGTAKVLAASIFFLAGLILMYLCCKKNGNHNAAISFMLLCASTFLILIYSLFSLITTDFDTFSRLVFLLPSSIILLFFPMLFRLLKRFQCTEAIEAECIDILCISGGYGRGSRRPRYHAIWKYSYNGTGYIHKDMASYKSPIYGERTELRIDPNAPHNIYRGKSPIISTYFIVVGLFIAVYALEPLIEKLPH